jgi:hypothetical protein
MAIKTYTPALSVMLTRLIDQKGGQPASATTPWRGIDLTPYLGTAGVVRTIKDIHAPAGGFSVTFADRLVPEFDDTAYALIEPMDLIEIRASRSPWAFVGQQLPLIMRGFVSSVDRAESISADGTPVRTVTVSGQDSGKLLQVHHVYFETMVLTDQDYLSTFHLQTQLGMDVGPLAVNEFMRQLIENVANKKISQLSVVADAQLKPFVVDASVPDGLVAPQMWLAVDAIDLWALAEMFADRPWNEMFVRDDEDGPHFVFRPAPYKDLTSGAFVLESAGAVDPGGIDLEIADVVAMTVARADTQVANLFVVSPGASTIDSNGQLGIAALQAGIPLDFGYAANKPEIFGTRKMMAGTHLLPQDTSAPINMLSKAQRAAAIGDVTQWYQARTLQLKEMNRDNSQFENVGMIVKGLETLTVGKYLRLHRGDVQSEGYITHVSHNFSPLSVWTTSLHLTRGNGFWSRNQSPASPYIGEGRAGPMTP